MKVAIQSLHIESSPLSQLRYHWFRGLYLGAGDSGLLVDAEVLKLSADPSLLQARLEKQVEIDGYSGLWRLIYWVFNLSNYAYSGYVLACYQARFQDETTPRFNGETLLWANLSYTLKWAREKLRSLFQGNDSRALVKVSDAGVEGDRAGLSEGPLSFKVTKEMIAHFTLLGREVKEGDEVSMELFKALYHRELLKTHPDKGGSAEAFDKVRHAAKTILGLVQGTLSPEDALSRACDDLERKLNELDIRIEELERGFEAIRQGFEEIRRDHEEIRRDQQALIQGFRAIGQRFDNMRAEVIECHAFLTRIKPALDIVSEVILENPKALLVSQSDKTVEAVTEVAPIDDPSGAGVGFSVTPPAVYLGDVEKPYANSLGFFSASSPPPNITLNIGSDAGPASGAGAASSQGVRRTGM